MRVVMQQRHMCFHGGYDGGVDKARMKMLQIYNNPQSERVVTSTFQRSRAESRTNRKAMDRDEENLEDTDQ